MLPHLILTFATIVIIASSSSPSLSNTSWISPSKLEHHIDAAIQYLCINQDIDGGFLYEFHLYDDKITFPEENNFPRQSGAFYSLGLFYRILYYPLYHDQDIFTDFSMTECICKSIQYLTDQSISVYYNFDNDDTKIYRGQLVAGNTGATALALMGMIEICVAEQYQHHLMYNNICYRHKKQLIAWIKGLISMKNIKHEMDQYKLKQGAFAKHSDDALTESSQFYDSEAYVAFARLYKFENFLFAYIDQHDTLWKDISDVIHGLDEYYLKYRQLDDTHWLIQAWFDRWIALNYNQPSNIFLDDYIVSDLMNTKWNEKLAEMAESSHFNDKAVCCDLEAAVDLLHATLFTSPWLNGTQSDLVEKELWDLLMTKIKVIMDKQMFKDQVDYYYESRFDGAFRGDSQWTEDKDIFRIDITQHCVSVLIKMHSLLYLNTSNSHSYTFHEQDMVEAEGVFGTTYSYDVMVSAIGLIVVIILVNIVFFYWCWYYPKQQKRNQLFDYMTGSDVDLESSHDVIGGIGNAGFADVDEYDTDEDR